MGIQLNIDPEFKSLIPPLSEDELNQLEQNLLAYGRCRDNIIVWRGLILDGHNRYALCQKHSLPFDVTHIRLASRRKAVLWILENQLGRRNLTMAMRIELAYRKALLIQQQHPIDLRKTTAKAVGTSERTVYKFLKIRKLADPVLLEQVKCGKIKISAAYKGLEITTKIVEPWPVKGVLEEKYRLRSVMGNLSRIEKLYKYLSDIPLDSCEGDIDCICKGLTGQMKILEELAVNANF